MMVKGEDNKAPYQIERTGELMTLRFAGEDVKCVACEDSLTHYPSGYKIGNLENYKFSSSNMDISNKDAALLLIDELERKFTKEEILKRLNTAPVINF